MGWMDANKPERVLKKQLAVEALRQPLVQAERSNDAAAHRTRIRDVSSRYMSTSISLPSAAKRSPSPSPVSRLTTSSASVEVPKRAVSVERKRPSTPASPSRLSTPVRDIDVSLAARKLVLKEQPKSLWPSTMRSLSVSFQSDGSPSPTAKKEKPVTHSLRDRGLRLSSNASRKVPDSPPSMRKSTPERGRSPVKGKSLLDQVENAKPAGSSQTRLVDQLRWPSRLGGKISSAALNQTIDFTDKIIRSPSTPLSTSSGIPSLRRLSGVLSKPLQKASSNVTNQISVDRNILERKRPELDSPTDPSNLLKLPELRKLAPSNLSNRITLATPEVRSQSLPRSRQPSPIRTASQSKVSSTSQSRPATPTRGFSPSRTRPLSSSSQFSSPTSVLSFITDLRKPKNNNQLEDAHQLRLLYNRHLQWRFANARTDVSLRIQKVTAEKSLHNAWRTKLALWDLVTEKKVCLQQMRLESKLNLILNELLRYQDDWTSLERNHLMSLAGIIKDLEASTLRLPLTGGARADIESLKIAIGSAMDVMQSMGATVITLLSRAEGMNSLVSGLDNLAVQERAVLAECERLLAMNAAIQVEENSLHTHLIQTSASID